MKYMFCKYFPQSAVCLFIFLTVSLDKINSPFIVSACFLLSNSCLAKFVKLYGSAFHV